MTHRIIGRIDWRPEFPRGGHTVDSLRDPFTEVIVHHAIAPNDPPTVSEDKDARGMRAIDRYHHAQGWTGYGYQFGVTPAGRIFEGRGWNNTGAHTIGHNSPKRDGSWGLGICLHMNGDTTDVTDQAWEALAWLIAVGQAYARIEHGAPIVGHRKYAPKSCPGHRLTDQRLTDLSRWIAAGGVKL